MRSVVVLPHPEGPRSTTNSPSWMESDTSLTAATVSIFLLRFSKSNSPNGCSPRLLPAIRELWRQGARRTLRSFPGPSIIGVSPPGINRRRAFRIGLRCTTRIMLEYSSTDKVGFDSKSPMSDFFPLSIEVDRVRPITPEYGLLRGECWTTVPLPPPLHFGTGTV